MFAISNERSSWSRGCSFTWQRSRTAGVIAAIQVRTEGDAVRLAYQHRGPGESWKSENYWVNVEWTPCHYGGQRAWLTIVDSGVYQHDIRLTNNRLFHLPHTRNPCHACIARPRLVVTSNSGMMF